MFSLEESCGEGWWSRRNITSSIPPLNRGRKECLGPAETAADAAGGRKELWYLDPERDEGWWSLWGYTDAVAEGAGGVELNSAHGIAAEPAGEPGADPLSRANICSTGTSPPIFYVEVAYGGRIVNLDDPAGASPALSRALTTTSCYRASEEASWGRV